MHSTHDEVDLSLVVQSKFVIAEEVCLLTLGRADEGRLPSWSPGAHIDVVVGEDLIRQYSLCGPPTETHTWQIAVLREKEGRGASAFVHDRTGVGDVLNVHGPRNNFPLVEATGYVFIAGGIGITPLLPMIADAERRGASWRLVYGGRTRASMAFADQLLAEHPTKVVVLPHDQVGQLPLPQLRESHTEGTAIYCCGPETLIEAAEHAFGAGVQPSLHVERFSPRSHQEPASAAAFEVELSRTGKVVRVASDETILEALLAVGVHAPQSCTEGICGTCEVTVLAGTPEHRDSLLSDEERDANETMFICVSRSLSARLTIDL